MRNRPILKGLAFVGTWCFGEAMIYVASVAGCRVLTAILSVVMLMAMCLVFGDIYFWNAKCNEAREGETDVADKDLEQVVQNDLTK